MNSLNSSQLAAFAEIIRQGSFDGAAKKLNVTASAISQRIKQLEDRLGQVLLVREIPCRPTRAGQELLKHANQVDLLEKELIENMGAANAALSQPLSLSISVNADSLDGWFVHAFETCCSSAPILLDIRVEDQDYSAQMLRDGEVMAAIAASPLAPQGCSAERLGSMRYLALCSPAFFSRHFQSGVNESTLTQAPTLIYNAKDDMQQSFAKAIVGRPIHPPAHFIPSTSSFVHLARQGFGWGMIPEHMANELMVRGELVEVAPGRHIDVDLYFHRWKIKSRALDILSTAIRTAAQQYLRPVAGCPI